MPKRTHDQSEPSKRQCLGSILGYLCAQTHFLDFLDYAATLSQTCKQMYLIASNSVSKQLFKEVSNTSYLLSLGETADRRRRVEAIVASGNTELFNMLENDDFEPHLDREYVSYLANMGSDRLAGTLTMPIVELMLVAIENCQRSMISTLLNRFSFLRERDWSLYSSAFVQPEIYHYCREIGMELCPKTVGICALMRGNRHLYTGIISDLPKDLRLMIDFFEGGTPELPQTISQSFWESFYKISLKYNNYDLAEKIAMRLRENNLNAILTFLIFSPPEMLDRLVVSRFAHKFYPNWPRIFRADKPLSKEEILQTNIPPIVLLKTALTYGRHDICDIIWVSIEDTGEKLWKYFLHSQEWSLTDWWISKVGEPVEKATYVDMLSYGTPKVVVSKILQTGSLEANVERIGGFWSAITNAMEKCRGDIASWIYKRTPNNIRECRLALELDPEEFSRWSFRHFLYHSLKFYTEVWVKLHSNPQDISANVWRRAIESDDCTRILRLLLKHYKPEAFFSDYVAHEIRNLAR